MSGIKRGVKKVFRGVKKVIKKVAKPALIIGGTLLTAGLVTGGFAAFKGVTTMGGFFKATGQTLLLGGQSIAGSLGLTDGVTQELANDIGLPNLKGADLFSGTAAQALGLEGPSNILAGRGPLSNEAFAAATNVSRDTLSGLGGYAASGYSTAKKASGGLFRKVASAFGGLSDMGQYAVINGIMGGIGGMMEERELRRQERREDRLGVFGTPRRGEGGYTPEQIAQMFEPYRLKTPEEFLSPYQSQLAGTEETTLPKNRMPMPRQPLLG